MKPIESNNNIITLDNSGTNKRQKKDAGQLPQTPSDSTQGFSAENEQDNNYAMEEKAKNYKPLKHIFTFLKNGKINSLESLEEDILSHNNKEHNADEFNKLFIKVILHYGDFASLTNSVKLVSKLQELGCDKELLYELEKLGHNPGITLDIVAENPTNN